MKKIIMTAAAVFALTFVNAQDSKESMRFGVKGGMNMASMAGGEDGMDPSMKAGSHIGGFGEFMISKKFAVQPELMYSTQGAKLESIESTVRLGYLNVPVLAKYFVNDKFSLEAGPQIGFLLSAKNDFDSGDEVDVKDGFNSTDVGLNFGTAYDFTENITAGLRYMMGLSGLEKDLPSGASATNNSVFQLSVGYIF